MQDDLRRVDHDISNVRNQIRDYEANKGGRLAAYGSGDVAMNSVLREIDELDKQRRWAGQKPIGPFGLYLELKRPEYASIIETLLKDTLNSFGVENVQDQRLLLGILKKNRCQCSIFKYENRSFDFQRGEASEQFTTVYRCLVVKNDVVLRQLVINNSIEKTVLVGSHREGDEITRSGFPQNVSAVYTKDLFSCGSKFGGLSTTAVNPYRGHPRLAKQTSDFIEYFLSHAATCVVDFADFQMSGRSANVTTKISVASWKICEQVRLS